MLKNRRGLRRKQKRISLKRKLQWMGAWTAVVMIFTLMAGLFFLTISGLKNVCESVLAKQTEQEKGLSSETPSIGSSDGSIVTHKKKQGVQHEIVQNENSSEGNRGNRILVNKECMLPEDYEVTLTSLNNGQQVAADIYEDLRDMLFTGEEEENLSFLVASGYRTKEKQRQLLEEEINKNMSAGMTYREAYEDALLTVAPPGYSEHETGLAVDIVAVSNQRLDDTQEYTLENQWLQENCCKYGFILRYPRDKEDVTGFSYESWHFRYVGKTAAKEITEQGITLEEYLKEAE